MFLKILGIIAIVTFTTAWSKKLPSQAMEVPESHAPRAQESAGATEEPVKEEIVPRLAWEGKHRDANKWTIHLMKELDVLGADILQARPEDRKLFCPNFDNLNFEQRKLFYAHLISKMAQYESGYDPSKTYVECSSKPTTYGKDGKFFASKGKWCIPGHAADGGIAISRGLVQMSMESAQGYKCPIKSPQDLHDPNQNLSCVIRIMNRFIPAPRIYEGKVRGHNRIAGEENGKWKGAAAYWAVMRDSSGYAKESYLSIRKYVSSLAFCK